VKKSINRRFQERLLQLRKQRGWTQERAAEECKIGYKMYQLYELGIKRNPGLITIEKIARGFGLDIYELFSPTLPRVAVKPPKK